MILSSPLNRCLIILSFFFVSQTFAQVKLPTVFSDNMVLQSGKPVKIWGTASAGESVTVSFGKQKKQTKANESGKWQVVLNALAVSADPADLEITASNNITLKMYWWAKYGYAPVNQIWI